MVYNAYHVPPYETVTADDTAQNVRDRSGGTVTPFDQGTSASDRAITAHIRREIMSRPELSIDAQNIKIITTDGRVTLRGPVRNQEEEQKIIEIARNAVAENAKVTNQIQTIDESPRSGSIPTSPSSN
jgi:osmotically-inducible protein OsmY